MLRWRLPLGTLMIAVLVGLCWLDCSAAVPGMWLLPVAICVTVMASQEVLHLAAAADLHPSPWIVYLGNLLLVGINWVPLVLHHGSEQAACLERNAWPLLALAIGLLLAFAGEIRRYEKPGKVTANLAATMLAMVYVGLMLSLVVQLRLVWGIGALASLLIVVKMGDTGAYTVGRLVGRHKLAPILSPGKTVEGAIGALLFACVASWATFTWVVPYTVTAAVGCGPSWGWLPFGLLVGTAGILGDLAESLIKRDAGQKDSSNWLPGLGGVMDLVDSVLLAAPVAWLCWLLELVGR